MITHSDYGILVSGGLILLSSLTKMINSTDIFLRLFKSKNIFARTLRGIMLVVLIIISLGKTLTNYLDGNILDALFIPVSFLLIYCLLKFGRIFSAWYWDDDLVERIEKLASKKALLFSYDNLDNLGHYQNFKTFKHSYFQSYSIQGTVDGTQARYFQLRRFFTHYSVAMINMPRYERSFKHIHITPKNILSLKAGDELEWIEYNKIFVNTLEDPRQAREVLTTTFMEVLVDTQSKYPAFDIEYIEDQEYQIHALIVLERGYILPRAFYKFKNTDLEASLEQIKEFLKASVKLAKSI